MLVKLYWEYQIFIHWNAFEYVVCETANILFGSTGANTQRQDIYRHTTNIL